MYQIKVNDKYDFPVHEEDGKLQLNGQPVSWDVSEDDNGELSILWNKEHYKATIRAIDRKAKTMEVKVNNNIYHLQIKDEFDLLLEKMGMHRGAGTQLNELKSPMPGLVLEINVNVGQAVEKGDPLLILEAMKMENVLKSPGQGTVKAIPIKAGDAVEKNQLLIEFE